MTRRNAFVRRRRRHAVVLGLAVGLLALGGCRARRSQSPDSDDPAVVAVALRKQLDKDPTDVDARRQLALIEWIHLGQRESALGHAAKLAATGDTTGRLIRLVAADARMQYDAIAREAYALVEAATKADADHYADVAAEFAARRIREHHGRLADDDARFVAFYDGLDMSRLPVEVRQPLVSQRAAIARRMGKDYAPYYDAEGCVQDWKVGPVQGQHGALDLLEIEPGPLTSDDEAVLAKLACVVRVWNPQAAPGVRRMQAYLKTGATKLSLELGAQMATRFWLDGKPLHRTDDTEKYQAERVRYEVDVTAGVHTIELATAIDAERAWVLVRATDGQGDPVAVLDAPTGAAGSLSGQPRPVADDPRWAESSPLGTPYAAPLLTILRVEDAIADGDPDRGERVWSHGRSAAYADEAPFAEGKLWAAELWRLDDSRGSTASQTRQRRALRAAISADPTVDAARLRLLKMRLSRGEEQEVAEALGKLKKGRLRSVEGELLRERVHRARGDEHAADAALDRAAKLNPDDCRVLIAQRARAQTRDDVRTEDDVVARMAPCAGSLKLRARLAERRGKLDEAKALWTEALARVPDELEALEALARLSALTEDHATAQAHLETILGLNPYRVGSHIAMADLAASRGEVDAARGHIERALVQIPYATALWEAAQTLGLDDELPRWRIDGLEALRDYQKSGETYEGVQEVLVLDRSAVRVYPDGGQRQLVHIVVHLLSKEALDRYGEMNVPDGGRLLTLRTIKPDGTMLEPEVVAGKDGVSLRELKVGDFVEYEFVIDQPASPQLPGYVDVSTFRFQSFDTPYHRSELLVVAPAELPLRSDRRNDPPEEVVKEVEVGGAKLVTRFWRAERVPRLGVEPSARPVLEEVPSVHVYTPLPLPAWLKTMASQIREAQRTNPELRAHTRRLVGKKKGRKAKVHRLWSWVVDNVEPAGDLTVPATETFAAKAGNRLMLLRAMLNEVGIESELWLLKDAYGPKPLPGGHPLVEMYDAPMLAVSMGEGKPPLLVNTASEVIPLGYLAPGYQEAPALRLPLDGGRTDDAQVVTPDAPANLRDGRQWSLRIDLTAAGDATIEGELSLTGMEAVRWRQALDQFDRDRVPDLFLEAELGWLRGASLSDLTIEGETDLQAPLRLHFSATGSGLGVAQGGQRVVQATPMPLSLSPAYASLPKRTTGLQIPYAPDQRARIEYHLDGAKFDDVPEAVDLQTAYGHFTTTIVDGGKGLGHLVLEVDSTLQTGVVEPSAYPGLAAFAQSVVAAQQGVLRLR